MHQVFDGVDFVFVKHPLHEREGGLYGDDVGTYGDNQFRFTLLSHAACEAPLKIDFGEGASANGYTGTYGDDVVFVANDWHAGLVPLLVASEHVRSGCTRTLAPSPRFTTSCTRAWSRTRRSVTWAFPGSGTTAWSTSSRSTCAHELDLGLVVNILKGAIATSDRVLTVSEGYANEIITARREGARGDAGGARHPWTGVGERHRHGRMGSGERPALPLAVRRVGSRRQDGVQARASEGDGLEVRDDVR